MTTIDESGLKADYVSHNGDDVTTVNAARISRNPQIENDKGDLIAKTKIDAADKKLIYSLAESGYTSPFEHNSITFIIACPLYIGSQIQRHRTFSYNEMRDRSITISDDTFIPSKFKKQDVDNEQSSKGEFTATENEKLRDLMEYCNLKTIESYTKLLDRGVSKEDAKIVLPQNLMTRFYMTGNLRNWFQFLTRHLDESAQEEVRIISRKILKELLLYYPVSGFALALSMFNKETLAEFNIVKPKLE